MERIKDINDNYLQEVLETASLSLFDLLKVTEFKSSIWDFHVSGLAFGIWLSLCDKDYISQNNIEDDINNRVRLKLS